MGLCPYGQRPWAIKSPHKPEVSHPRPKGRWISEGLCPYGQRPWAIKSPHKPEVTSAEKFFCRVLNSREARRISKKQNKRQRRHATPRTLRQSNNQSQSIKNKKQKK